MKRILATVAVIATLATTAHAQCDMATKIVYHPNHMDIDDTASYWFWGVNFTAYDEVGRLIGRSPIPIPPGAHIRPVYFPLHIYGDDPFTKGVVEGPTEGQTFYINCNLLKGCQRMKTDKPAVFKAWTNGRPGLQHPGDVNKDKKIDMLDYKLVQASIGSGVYLCECDVNADGVVDAADGGLVGRVVLWNDPKSTIGKWGYACQ